MALLGVSMVPALHAQEASSSPPPASTTTNQISRTDILTPEDIGDALMIHQRYQAAIEAYQRVTPETARSLNKLGIAYQMMFDNDDAMRCYRASLRIDPRNTHVLNNLATLYDSLKDFRAAEKIYRRALQIDPHSALITKNLGTNLLAQHKFEKGWDSYQAALALDPGIFKHDAPLHIGNPATVENRGAVNYYLARSCARAGLNDRAIEYLRSALNEGFTSPGKIAADTEFASLQDLPAFHKLLTEQQSR
jgi:tetratricopeptide (TPR) repeat protein